MCRRYKRIDKYVFFIEFNRYLKVIALKFIVFLLLYFSLEPPIILIDFTLMILRRIYFNITMRNKHT